MTDRPRPRRAVGVHLMPVLSAIDTPRPSIVVEVDRDGAVTSLHDARSLDDIAAAVGDAPAVVVIDAPLAVPDSGGRRSIDELLGWLDTPVLPISRARMDTLYGGARGEEIARHEAFRPHDIAEGFPDLLLRLLAWERRRPPGTVDLAEFRGRWLDLRPASYRPKGIGRAKPAGFLPAFDLLSDVVDFGGWAPTGRDDWGMIRDAAVLDAAAGAHVAWRAVHGTGVTTVRILTDGAQVLLPCDANLAERIEVNRIRMNAARPGALERV